MVTAVVFDVGETLLDDSREWGAWADWVGVPRVSTRTGSSTRTAKAASKHSNNVFTKLGLAQLGDDNRRVLAVLAYLNR